MGRLGVAEGRRLYRKLLLARGVEEAIREVYPSDQLKTPVHLGIGQEAIPVGVHHCLRPGTKAFGTYRNHALYTAMTGETDALFGELYGKVTGGAKGKAGSMHLAAPAHGLIATSAVVATTIPIAVGAALANAYRHSDDLVVVFFGDGAVEEGAFWESLNFACLKRLRILFVCEDNDLAIHTPARARQGFRAISEAVRGFNCVVGLGNGSDVLDVITATRRLLRDMAQSGQPGFLQLTYFRALEHVGVHDDFDAGYRPRPTAKELAQRDPVRRFEDYLQSQGVSRDELAAIRASIRAQIAQSLRAAEAAPFPPPDELTTDVFA